MTTDVTHMFERSCTWFEVVLRLLNTPSHKISRRFTKVLHATNNTCRIVFVCPSNIFKDLCRLQFICLSSSARLLFRSLPDLSLHLPTLLASVCILQQDFFRRVLVFFFSPCFYFLRYKIRSINIINTIPCNTQNILKFATLSIQYICRSDQRIDSCIKAKITNTFVFCFRHCACIVFQ